MLRKVFYLPAVFLLAGLVLASSCLGPDRPAAGPDQTAAPDAIAAVPSATGEAIVGEYTGTHWTMIPAAIISWRDFKTAFPDGQVLSRETGFRRDYGRNPYTGYDAVGSFPLASASFPSLPTRHQQRDPEAGQLTLCPNGVAGKPPARWAALQASHRLRWSCPLAGNASRTHLGIDNILSFSIMLSF